MRHNSPMSKTLQPTDRYERERAGDHVLEEHEGIQPVPMAAMSTGNRTDQHRRQVQIGRLQRDLGNAHVARLIRSGQSVARLQVPQGGAELQRVPTPVGPATLATTPATAMSALDRGTLRQFRRLVEGGDPQGALMLLAQLMARRGEIEPDFLTGQPVAGHQSAECQGNTVIIVDPTVNGANTITCGCSGAAGQRLPNGRVRINFARFQQQALVSPRPRPSEYQLLAEILQSTLLHEFRHLRQDFEACNAAGAQSSGVCTDCNSPEEMDAYLAEIEAGYRPRAYRHAWVRVYVNWSNLAPSQQQVFAARRAAAEAKLTRALPGVNWAVDPDVTSYQAFCQTLDRRVGGNSVGACDSPLSREGRSAPSRTAGTREEGEP
jgi:hypothetical protein